MLIDVKEVAATQHGLALRAEEPCTRYGAVFNNAYSVARWTFRRQALTHGSRPRREEVGVAKSIPVRNSEIVLRVFERTAQSPVSAALPYSRKAIAPYY